MYSAFHGSVGVVLVSATYLVTKSEVLAFTLGGFLAFLSHDLIDRLGECSLGKGKTMITHEVIPYLIMIGSGLYINYFWLFFVGYICANGMDLIDKKMYLSVLFPKKHKASFWFKCHRRKPNIDLTYNQTKNAAWISCILIILTSIVIK